MMDPMADSIVLEFDDLDPFHQSMITTIDEILDFSDHTSVFQCKIYGVNDTIHSIDMDRHFFDYDTFTAGSNHLQALLSTLARHVNVRSISLALPVRELSGSLPNVDIKDFEALLKTQDSADIDKFVAEHDYDISVDPYLVCLYDSRERTVIAKQLLIDDPDLLYRLTNEWHFRELKSLNPVPMLSLILGGFFHHKETYDDLLQKLLQD